jgi:sulfur-oxidizing protein SoxY
MHQRRAMLARSARMAGMLAAAVPWPAALRAEGSGYDAAAFEATTLADLMKQLGARAPQESTQVSIDAPEIAENGAVVPVAASTSLPGVRKLLVLVEKNPAILSAIFEVSDSVEASFSTRVKMGQSSNVYAVAMLGDGRVLYAAKEVKVTQGGCGG